MKKILIILVIVCLLAVGFSSCSTRLTSSLRDMILNADNDGIVPVSPSSSVPFGGLTLMKHAYDKSGAFNTKEGYQAHDSMIMQLNAASSVTTSREGVTFAPATGENKFYVRFLTAEDSTAVKDVKVSEYDYFTVDFDISASLNTSYKIYLLFRDTGGKALGANENYVFAHLNIIAGNKSISYNDTVHVTLAYKFNASDGYTVCNVFFNGDYAASLANPSSTPVSALDYIEGLAIGDTTASEGDTFTVNNVEFNGFVKGYEGAVENMFKYPYTPLERNTDSVLFNS